MSAVTFADPCSNPATKKVVGRNRWRCVSVDDAVAEMWWRRWRTVLQLRGARYRRVNALRYTGRPLKQSPERLIRSHSLSFHTAPLVQRLLHHGLESLELIP